MNNLEEVKSENKLSDIVKVYGYFNLQYGERLMKLHHPILIVMRGVEHTESFFSIMCLK